MGRPEVPALFQNLNRTEPCITREVDGEDQAAPESNELKARSLGDWARSRVRADETMRSQMLTTTPGMGWQLVQNSRRRMRLWRST